MNGWVQMLVLALAALVVLIGAWLLSMWVRRLVYGSLTRAKFDETLSKFFAQVSRWALLVVAVLVVLSLFGIEPTSIAALIAALGLAIGLALQGTLANFASGVLLLALRPFKVGDVVEVAGELGTVDAIDLFFTQMDSFDNKRIILPNASVFNATIENLSHHPVRRADFMVGTAYDADLDQTRQVIFNALADVEGRDTDNPPQVLLLEMGDSSIQWSARIWAPTDDLWPTRDRAIRAVKYALDEAGITIPFPQRDVHMKQRDQGGAAASQ